MFCSAPGAARLDPFPGRAAEDAVLGAHRPAARVEGLLVAALRTSRMEFEPVGVRLEALAQVGRVGHPVVHLHVDVGMVIAAPGRLVAVVPFALQVGRQRRRREEAIIR